MNKAEYYANMRALARQKRTQFDLTTPEIMLSSIRNIYKQESITIDPCKKKLRNLKAAYFCDDYGCSVFLNMKLPEEPRLFAMLHELKHHFVDQDRLRCFCHDVDEKSTLIEIGAEVFAAEFIFPEHEFRQYVEKFINGTNISAEDIVHMKCHSPARVSYQFFTKSLERLGLIARGQFAKTQFHILHAKLYGSAHYHNRITK